MDISFEGLEELRNALLKEATMTKKKAAVRKHTNKLKRSAIKHAVFTGGRTGSYSTGATRKSIEAVSSRDDVNKLLKDSVVEGFKLEVWEIDLAGEKQAEKYPALYAIGSLNTWELPSNVEELAAVSAEMAIDGKPQAGFATVSAELQEQIMYAFKDVTAY